MANVGTRTEQQHTSASAKVLLDSADFKSLVAKRLSVSMTLLVLLFVSYYGYIVLVGMAKEWVSQKIGESAVTYGIPIGQAVIVVAFVLTAIYVAWANNKYDPEVERLKKQLIKR